MLQHALEESNHSMASHIDHSYSAPAGFSVAEAGSFHGNHTTIVDGTNGVAKASKLNPTTTSYFPSELGTLDQPVSFPYCH